MGRVGVDCGGSIGGLVNGFGVIWKSGLKAFFRRGKALCRTKMNRVLQNIEIRLYFAVRKALCMTKMNCVLQIN